VDPHSYDKFGQDRGGGGYRSHLSLTNEIVDHFENSVSQSCVGLSGLDTHVHNGHSFCQYKGYRNVIWPIMGVSGCPADT